MGSLTYAGRKCSSSQFYIYILEYCLLQFMWLLILCMFSPFVSGNKKKLAKVFQLSKDKGIFIICLEQFVCDIGVTVFAINKGDKVTYIEFAVFPVKSYQYSAVSENFSLHQKQFQNTVTTVFSPVFNNGLIKSFIRLIIHYLKYEGWP